MNIQDVKIMLYFLGLTGLASYVGLGLALKTRAEEPARLDDQNRYLGEERGEQIIAFMEKLLEDLRREQQQREKR